MKRVLIIGSGLSGLSCAIELAENNGGTTAWINCGGFMIPTVPAT